MAATMRSLTSPVMAPLYSPTQARSDCSASRSACPIALAVSVSVCSAGGRIGTVATAFGLAPAVDRPGLLAPAVPQAAMNIKVAASHDLMTNPRVIDYSRFKHICLVGDRWTVVHGKADRTTVVIASEAIHVTARA